MRGYVVASGLGSVLSTLYLWSRERVDRLVPSVSSLPISHSKEVEDSGVISSSPTLVELVPINLMVRSNSVRYN